MNPIVQLILEETPALIGWIQAAHAKKNPDAPPLTADQIFAAFDQAFNDSITKDKMLEAALQAELDAKK